TSIRPARLNGRAAVCVIPMGGPAVGVGPAWRGAENRMSWRSTMILVVWAVGIAPLLMLPGRATAQSGSGGVIRGRVVAADTDEPLAAASVVARTGRDTVTAAMTDAVGRFLLTGLRPGQYTIEVGFLGHAAATRTVTLPGDGSIDLGTLRIAPV